MTPLKIRSAAEAGDATISAMAAMEELNGIFMTRPLGTWKSPTLPPRRADSSVRSFYPDSRLMLTIHSIFFNHRYENVSNRDSTLPSFRQGDAFRLLR